VCVRVIVHKIYWRFGGGGESRKAPLSLRPANGSFPCCGQGFYNFMPFLSIFILLLCFCNEFKLLLSLSLSTGWATTTVGTTKSLLEDDVEIGKIVSIDGCLRMCVLALV